MIDNQSTKNCPFCGEEILVVAIKCKHCGEFLDDRNINRDVSKQVIIKNREGIFLKSMNLGCGVALVIGLILLISLSAILYAISGASRNTSNSGGNSSQSSSSGNQSPSNSVSEATEIPYTQCGDNGISWDGANIEAKYILKISKVLEMKVPGSITINPIGEDPNNTIVVKMSANKGMTVTLTVTPSDSTNNNGNYLWTDPGGSNIAWTDENALVSKHPLIYEYTFLCNGPYYFYTWNITEAKTLKVAEK